MQQFKILTILIALCVGSVATVHASSPSQSLLDEQLMVAVERGDIIKVQSLLEAGANPNAMERRIKPPLIKAIEQENIVLVQVLLEAGADCNLPEDSFGGDAPLRHAAYVNNVDLVRLLIKYGAQVNQQNKLGATALIYAAWSESLEIATLLIDAGADVNVQDEKGEHAFIWAIVRNNYRKDSFDMVQLLMDSGADINLQDVRGETALMVAARYNRHKIIRWLIALGADVTLQDEDGKTALAYSGGIKTYLMLNPSVRWCQRYTIYTLLFAVKGLNKALYPLKYATAHYFLGTYLEYLLVPMWCLKDIADRN